MRDALAQSNLRGIGFMLAAMTFFIVGDALTKAAGARGAGLPVGELLFLRSISAVLVLFPFVWSMGALARLPQLYSRPMLIRNIGEVCGSLLYVTSLIHIPLANATSIMQTSPLVITAAAALLLGDRIGWRRWTATAVGFIGALLIIRPTSPDFSLWYVPAIVSVAFVTMRDLGTRQIDKVVPTQLITFLQFFGSLATGPVRTFPHGRLVASGHRAPLWRRDRHDHPVPLLDRDLVDSDWIYGLGRAATRDVRDRHHHRRLGRALYGAPGAGQAARADGGEDRGEVRPRAAAFTV